MQGGARQLVGGGDALAEGAGRPRGRAIARQAERPLAVVPLSAAVLLRALSRPRKVGGPYGHDLGGDRERGEFKKKREKKGRDAIPHKVSADIASSQQVLLTAAR